MSTIQSIYSYNKFLMESSLLLDNIINSRFNIKFNQITCSLTGIKYLKTKIYQSNQSNLFSIYIIYSEIYNSPFIYFNIYNTDKNEYIKMEDYLLYQDKESSYNNLLLKNSIEINYTNFPFTGEVMYCLSLCNFNIFISKLNCESTNDKEKEDINTLLIWFTYVLNLLLIKYV